MALRGASNPQVIINAQTKGLWTAAQREDATRLLQQVLASPVAARARIAPERFAEEPFVLHYQGCLLEGMIDLAFSEKEAWVLVDFKTAQVRETEVTAQAAVYRPQLYLCALALERLTGRPVAEILLLFVRTQQEVRWTWGERERTETEEFVMKISKGKDKVEDHP
jgi:ATP-dependent exoDNAse (exonuclease V) beta subunit